MGANRRETASLVVSVHPLRRRLGWRPQPPQKQKQHRPGRGLSLGQRRDWSATPATFRSPKPAGPEASPDVVRYLSWARYPLQALLPATAWRQALALRGGSEVPNSERSPA